MTEHKTDINLPEVTNWLNTLYRDAHGYLHIATTGNWTGHFFNTDHGYDQAAHFIQRLNRTNTSGIYARITTLSELPEGKGQRGGRALSSSLPALWADLDMAGPGHKHTPCTGGPDCDHLTDDRHRKHAAPVLPLPPDEDAVRAIVADTGLPAPTLWVHSGGGLYPMWLIDPVHQISGDLAEVEHLSTEWQRVIAAAAERAGWEYGAGVGDLARVLRIPGTWNRKTLDARQCRVLEWGEDRYALRNLVSGVEYARRRLPIATTSPPVTRRAAPARVAGDVRPGDDFVARVDWSDPLLLGKLGWTVVNQNGSYREWLRSDPGSTSSLSATTGRDGYDNLYVFSTETPFPMNEPISKLEAFRIIHGYPSLTDAVRALNRLGFGTPAIRAESVAVLPAVLDPLAWPPGSVPLRPVAAPPNGTHVTVEAVRDPVANGVGQLWAAADDGDPQFVRRIVLTPASAIKPRRVRWGWKDGDYGRCPVGEITLVPGREGVGKSLLVAWLIANLTRGTLPGEFAGKPRAVLYSTAEDSWEHTVVPRLIAAGADTDLVFRVEVEVEEIGRTKLILPRDCRRLAEVAKGIGAAALMLDPIISLIDDELSVNQSRELRVALEPLRDTAERAHIMVVALAHFNKMVDVDILSKIPGARAWVEVARAAIALAEDAEQGLHVASQVKNNLGRRDLPHLTYRIDRVWLDTDEGPATADTGKLVWTGTSPTGVDQIMERKPKSKAAGQGSEVVEFVAARYAETGQAVPTAEVMAGLPHLSENTVRQALSRAVNRDSLERPLHGHYKPVDDDE